MITTLYQPLVKGGDVNVVPNPNPKIGGGKYNFIVIASDQRSSSTALLMDLWGASKCIFHFNELFNARNTEQQTNKASTALGPTLYYARHQRANEALDGCREWKCRSTNCSQCVVVIKLFSNHLSDDIARSVLAREDVFVVRLDRNVRDRYCSLSHALSTGDWKTRGPHGVDHASCRSKTISVQEQQFITTHRKWGRFISTITSQKNTPQFYLHFTKFVNDSARYVDRILELIDFRDRSPR